MMLKHCWLGGRKGIRPVKNGGWWKMARVSPDGVAPSQMVGVSSSVNLPLHHKVQKFSSGTSVVPEKGRKTVVWYMMLKHIKTLWSQGKQCTVFSRSAPELFRMANMRVYMHQITITAYIIHSFHILCSTQVNQRRLERGCVKNCQARKLNREVAMDHSRWKKLIKEGWWPG